MGLNGDVWMRVICVLSNVFFNLILFFGFPMFCLCFSLFCCLNDFDHDGFLDGF